MREGPPRGDERRVGTFGFGGRLAVAAGLLLAAAPAPGYENEKPTLPADGQVVGSKFEFYIAADGKPGVEEFYRVEVATEDEFKPEQVVLTIDMRDNRRGWVLGTSYGLKDVPEEYRPVNYEGIHYRVFNRLKSGEYYWRALKALGGGEWTPLGRPMRFRVDRTPPGPVEEMRLARRKDGAIAISWAPVVSDAEGEPELVAGYRVYRYAKLLKRYPPSTRFLLAETDRLEVVVPADAVEGERIVFFRVQAVDEVGNELNRPLPAPMGSFEAKFHPPDADLLTNPEYLKRLSEEAGTGDDH
ncbi:MAG: hypothetical protein D6718_09255 [Acidobacteria bacterium]|nr:MAG: hypothetical protein D6718_09255 [Acidobacteriota bacterium]